MKVRKIKIVLGFDPGSRHIGWGQVGGGKILHGVLDGQTLKELYLLVGGFLRGRPDVIGIEEPETFSDKYGSEQTAKAIFASLNKVSRVCGIIEGIAYVLGIPVRYHKKSTINRELCRDPTAKKATIQESVRLWLGLERQIKPQHANDAMAVAIVTANHFNIEGRIKS